LSEMKTIEKPQFLTSVNDKPVRKKLNNKFLQVVVIHHIEYEIDILTFLPIERL